MVNTPTCTEQQEGGECVVGGVTETTLPKRLSHNFLEKGGGGGKGQSLQTISHNFRVAAKDYLINLPVLRSSKALVFFDLRSRWRRREIYR